MKIEWALWPALASASSSLTKGMSHTYETNSTQKRIMYSKKTNSSQTGRPLAWRQRTDMISHFESFTFVDTQI